MFSVFQPTLQRLRTLLRHAARQQTLDTDVFVEIRPMDAASFSNEAPLCSLGLGAMRKSRKPCDWNSDRPAVGKVDAQRVVIDRNHCCQHCDV